MRELFQAPPQYRPEPPIPQDRPVYRILSEKGFFGPDDSLHPEGSIIVLYDSPNEDMEPLNQMAHEAMDKYLDALEESARQVAEKNGRYFAGRPRSKDELIEAASSDARRVQTVQFGAGVPIMGARNQSSKRIQKVGVNEVADTGMAAVQAAKRAKIETITA